MLTAKVVRRQSLSLLDDWTMNIARFPQGIFIVSKGNNPHLGLRTGIPASSYLIV
jgi:hypothetical protein